MPDLQSLVEIDVAQKTAVDFPAPLMTITGELGLSIARETAEPVQRRAPLTRGVGYRPR